MPGSSQIKSVRPSQFPTAPFHKPLSAVPRQHVPQMQTTMDIPAVRAVVTMLPDLEHPATRTAPFTCHTS